MGNKQFGEDVKSGTDEALSWITKFSTFGIVDATTDGVTFKMPGSHIADAVTSIGAELQKAGKRRDHAQIYVGKRPLSGSVTANIFIAGSPLIQNADLTHWIVKILDIRDNETRYYGFPVCNGNGGGKPIVCQEISEASVLKEKYRWHWVGSANSWDNARSRAERKCDEITKKKLAYNIAFQNCQTTTKDIAIYIADDESACASNLRRVHCLK